MRQLESKKNDSLNGQKRGCIFFCWDGGCSRKIPGFRIDNVTRGPRFAEGLLEAISLQLHTQRIHLSRRTDPMSVEITQDEISKAMAQFLEGGGKINRIEHVAGEPVMGLDYLIPDEIMEMVDTQDSDLY
jgi:hypothetical protein